MTTRSLYLTFDDGPDPERTPVVLDALRRYEATATFFVLGAAARRSPATLEAILEAGHRVELHGDEHLDHRSLDVDQLAVDTDRALATLNHLGVSPTWWRLPWGRPGPATASVASTLGLRIAGWDLDTHDWRGDWLSDQPAGAAGRAARGGVVLMHDGLGPGATRSTIDNTITLIDGFATLAHDHGMALRALPDPGDAAAHAIGAHPGPEVVAVPAPTAGPAPWQAAA